MWFIGTAVGSTRAHFNSIKYGTARGLLYYSRSMSGEMACQLTEASPLPPALFALGSNVRTFLRGNRHVSLDRTCTASCEERSTSRSYPRPTCYLCTSKSTPRGGIGGRTTDEGSRWIWRQKPWIGSPLVRKDGEIRRILFLPLKKQRNKQSKSRDRTNYTSNTTELIP